MLDKDLPALSRGLSADAPQSARQPAIEAVPSIPVVVSVSAMPRPSRGSRAWSSHSRGGPEPSRQRPMSRAKAAIPKPSCGSRDAAERPATGRLQLSDTAEEPGTSTSCPSTSQEAASGQLPAAAAESSASVHLTVRSASGKEKVHVFTHRPLKVEYKCELLIHSPGRPHGMRVTAVAADGEGAREGLQVGDTLFAVNGLMFEGNDAAACHLLLQEAFESLPSVSAA